MTSSYIIHKIKKLIQAYSICQICIMASTKIYLMHKIIFKPDMGKSCCSDEETPVRVCAQLQLGTPPEQISFAAGWKCNSAEVAC